MLLFFLTFLSVSLQTQTGQSTLRHGDDPYKILHLSRSANPTEIRARYRELVFKLHPDKNIGKDTTAQYIKVKDAYELLTDPDRKTYYDRFGTVGDLTSSSIEEETFDLNTDRFFHHLSRVQQTPVTFLINQSNFDTFFAESGESLILIYSSVMCEMCDLYLNHFEELAFRINQFVRFARIDCAENDALAHHLNVTGMPTLYYHKNESGKITSDFLKNLVHSPVEMRAFLVNRWRKYMFSIEDLADLEAFLGSTPGKPKAIEIARDLNSTIAFEYLAGLCHRTAEFAIIDERTFSGHPFNVRLRPTWIVYRHGSQPPRIETVLKNVIDHLQKWALPTLLELTYENFAEVCEAECVVRIGKVSIEKVGEFCKLNFSTFWMEDQSKAAKSLNVGVGNWVVLRPSEKVFAVMSEDDRNLERKWIKRDSLEFVEMPAGFRPDWHIGSLVLKVGQFVYGISFKGLVVNLDFVITFGVILWFMNRKFKAWKASKRRRLPKPKLDVSTGESENVEKD
jgi:hypothetical protein